METNTLPKKARLHSLTSHLMPKPSLHSSDLKLFLMHPSIIVCFMSAHGLAQLVFYNLKTKRIIKHVELDRIPLLIDINLEVFLIKKPKKCFIAFRCSRYEFRFLDLSNFQIVFKLSLKDLLKEEAYLSVLNDTIATWSQGTKNLLIWNLFSNSPCASMRLPCFVTETHAHLPHRNLIVLQTGKTNELIFIDIIQKAVVGRCRMKESLVPSRSLEGAIFTIQISPFCQGLNRGKIFCYKLSTDFKLTDSHVISFIGAGIKAESIDNTTLLLMRCPYARFYNIGGQNLIRYEVNIQ